MKTQLVSLTLASLLSFFSFFIPAASYTLQVKYDGYPFNPEHQYGHYQYSRAIWTTVVDANECHRLALPKGYVRTNELAPRPSLEIVRIIVKQQWDINFQGLFVYTDDACGDRPFVFLQPQTTEDADEFWQRIDSTFFGQYEARAWKAVYDLKDYEPPADKEFRKVNQKPTRITDKTWSSVVENTPEYIKLRKFKRPIPKLHFDIETLEERAADRARSDQEAVERAYEDINARLIAYEIIRNLENPGLNLDDERPEEPPELVLGKRPLGGEYDYLFDFTNDELYYGGGQRIQEALEDCVNNDVCETEIVKKLKTENVDVLGINDNAASNDMGTTPIPEEDENLLRDSPAVQIDSPIDENDNFEVVEEQDINAVNEWIMRRLTRYGTRPIPGRLYAGDNIYTHAHDENAI